jgi:hypothetical protein
MCNLLLSEYRHDIFNTIITALIEEEDKRENERKPGLGFNKLYKRYTIITALIEEEDKRENERRPGLGFNKLYKRCKEIFRVSGRDYTPSRTDFSNHIRKMVEDNELQKIQDYSSKLRIKPEYYSLTDDAKKRRHLNLLGVGNEHERFRKIYEKLFFWEFFHTRPIPVPSEQKVNEIITTLKQKLDPSQLCDLGWGQVTDASNDFLRYEVGSKNYDEYWNNGERLEMIVQHIDSLYHVTSRPEIFFTKREYWGATKYSKKMLFAKYTLNLPGVSEEEFLKYNNRSSDVKFTFQDIKKAFLLLKQNGLIKPHLVFENKTRYVITTKDNLLKLIKEISQIFESELILLMFRWRYFEKPTKEEKKRLKWMLDETYARQIIQSAEIAMYENKKAIRDSKDIDEYCEFLRKDLSGFPTWAVDGQIYMDTSRFINKNKGKNIEAMTKDVRDFFEFRRKKQRESESDLIDGIKDIKKRYENTVQEYAYLFHHVLAMVCPLLLKLPAESYYSDEELEAETIASYKLEEKLNPPGFHESIHRHTDERGITDMKKVFDDMKKARTNHKKENKELKGKT